MPEGSGPRGAAIRLTDIRFRWNKRSEFELVLPRMELAERERVLLVGPSGSGKSTLLTLICGIAAPQAGTVEIAGKNISGLPAAQRDRHRADHLGIIFQMFNLVPYLSALDNILLPLSFSRVRTERLAASGQSQEAEAKRLLSRLGVPPEIFARKIAVELSVGQQQRVAAARALIGRPELIIADEPTSSLDRDRQIAFVNLLREEVEAAGATLLLVSHDLSLSGEFDRTIHLTELLGDAAATPEMAAS